LKVLLRPIEALHQPFESLQFAAEPRQTVHLGTSKAKGHISTLTPISCL
jgi:hypothetical protein